MRILYLLLCLVGYEAAAQKSVLRDSVDLLVFNGTIYTVDSQFNIATAMAVQGDRVVETGSEGKLRKKYIAQRELDLKGAFAYPGFIDAHCHFYKYAEGLGRVNLVGTVSWAEGIEKLKHHAAENTEGWLVGRGWDQNDWVEKNYPNNSLLNALFPDRPVVLHRVDGHAVIANARALSLAGITPATQIDGGEILLDAQQELTGLLVDNAVDLLTKSMPLPPDSLKNKLLHRAETLCLSSGLTTVVDCGLDYAEVEHLKKLYEQNSLHLRAYVMLSDKKENRDWLMRNGVVHLPELQVRSFKVYADGALGSRGACLLKPYTDRPDWRGFLLSAPSHFDSVAKIMFENNWQMCTHAIGDSANRIILQVYGKYLKKENDRRWRVEHAQVINPNDIPLFGQYSIIPSIQPTHATSDMYWAEERLGKERSKHAYLYQDLYAQNGWLAMGTDFPVESIDPLLTFYAAVSRRDTTGFPKERYNSPQALSREQALRGMTIWAARSIFEEGRKGSLEPGKFADFVILNKDIMHVPEHELPTLQVMKTYIAGKLRAEQRKLK